MHRLVVSMLLLAAACSSDATNGTSDPAPEPTPSAAGASASSDSSSAATPSAGSPAQLTVEVVDTIAHDTDSFTQGLVRLDDGFFESIGRYGESALLEVDGDGTIVRRVEVDDQFFAEGLEQVGDQLIQLTYQSGTAFVYDAQSFEAIDEFRYDGEGWGLCLLEDRLAMSNGSARISFRHPGTFAEEGDVEVTLDDEPLPDLNELECVDGTVWANVWNQDIIVGIDPASGTVHTVVDASTLRARSSVPDESVLNGISYDEATETFWLTGKNWPTVFEVRFVTAGG